MLVAKLACGDGKQRHAVERIFAQRHGRRPGVRLLAEDAHVHLDSRPIARDCADACARGLEHGALLDVQLQICRRARRLVGALPAALA